MHNFIDRVVVILQLVIDRSDIEHTRKEVKKGLGAYTGF